MSVVPSRTLASPTLSVDTRRRVSRYSFSACSMASHRSSSGERFQRSQLRHTTQRRPRAASNASRSPTGNASSASLAPRGLLQKRQVAYIDRSWDARRLEQNDRSNTTLTSVQCFGSWH